MLDIEKEMFNRILKLEANEVEISNSIKFLMRLLNNEYEKPVILLLDEYDEPLQTEYVKSYYKKAINFFKRFFSMTVKEQIERLLKDEEVEVTIDQETVIVGIEKNEDNIWGLLLGTGNLKVVETVDLTENRYKVQIPNREIKELFRSIIRDWFRDKVIGNDLNSILKDLVTLNLNEFRKIEEKKYEENLKERGFTNITKMVFAFNGKDVKMETF